MLKNKAFLLIPLVILFACKKNEESILFIDCEKENWHSELKLREEKNWGKENFQTVYDDERKKNVLSVFYPKGSASPNVTKFDGAPVGGAEFLAETGIYDSVYFHYFVKFDKEFDFVKGGKLPGLFGGTANSGGAIPTGYDGFSTRFMWRDSGIGELYAYMPSSQQWGTPLGEGKWNFVPGKWHSVQHQLVLNDPKVKNGKIKIWIDGKLIHKEESLLLRNTIDLKINGIFFSTFFGGNDTTWGASKDCKIYFDEMKLSEKFIE